MQAANSILEDGMRIAIAVLALMLPCSAMADELANANKFLESKDYPRALATFTKLANAGNTAAQFHLGEMYWYGEAGKIDLGQARLWLDKAAAGGNKEALEALQIMRERELRQADIAFWVSAYDGQDLKQGKFDCARPAIPAISKDSAAIKVVETAYVGWQQCYNGFVQNLNDALPPGKRIPPDISKLMNQIEYDSAVAHLDKVYARISGEAGTAAAIISADFNSWLDATSAFAKERNAAIDVDTKQGAEEMRQARELRNSNLGSSSFMERKRENSGTNN